MLIAEIKLWSDIILFFIFCFNNVQSIAQGATNLSCPVTKQYPMPAAAYINYEPRSKMLMGLMQHLNIFDAFECICRFVISQEELKKAVNNEVK